jgi:amidophosphoribosyltransferase
VTEAPIKYPCCYGVDFPSFKELVAGNFKGKASELEKNVAKKIGSDSVQYISFEGLKNALGGNGDKFCFACLTGKYPTEGGCRFLENRKC